MPSLEQRKIIEMTVEEAKKLVKQKESEQIKAFEEFRQAVESAEKNVENKYNKCRKKISRGNAIGKFYRFLFLLIICALIVAVVFMLTTETAYRAIGGVFAFLILLIFRANRRPAKDFSNEDKIFDECRKRMKELENKYAQSCRYQSQK